MAGTTDVRKIHGFSAVGNCSLELAQPLEPVGRALVRPDVDVVLNRVANQADAACFAGMLGAHPLTGRRVEGELRELLISYGRTGYMALYRFVIARDEVRILALRRQRELGFLP